MKKALAFAVLTCVALACEASTGRAEETLKAQKYIMVDTSTFKNALARAGKADSAWTLEPNVDLYGVFIDGSYAGQIGDTITVSQGKPVDFKIVGRLDGKSWSNLGVGKPAEEKLVGLYQTKNIFCEEGSAWPCQDVELEHQDKTEVWVFKESAFSGKLFYVTLGIGPTPGDKTDMKSIDIRTEPTGAEIYLDNIKYWQATNSVLSIPFAKRGNDYVPRSVTLRLSNQSKSSGTVAIKHENSFLSYKFETGFLEVK